MTHTCSICFKIYALRSTYLGHIARGHVKPDTLICFESRKCVLKIYDEILYGYDNIYQCTIIPWFRMNNGNLEFVNVSVGVTTYDNVPLYANRIWLSVRTAIQKGDIRITTCGSASAAVTGLEWFMMPYLACSTGIYVHKRDIATKVKGLIRDLVDSVRFSSPADLSDVLEPCKMHIFEKIQDLINCGKLAPHNELAFHQTKQNNWIRKPTFEFHFSDVYLRSNEIDIELDL